jgi:hypothetical protein
MFTWKHLIRGKDRRRGLLIAVIHTEVPHCAVEPYGAAGQWGLHFAQFLSSHCLLIIIVRRNRDFSMSVSDWTSRTCAFLYFRQINTLHVSNQIRLATIWYPLWNKCHCALLHRLKQLLHFQFPIKLLKPWQRVNVSNTATRLQAGKTERSWIDSHTNKGFFSFPQRSDGLWGPASLIRKTGVSKKIYII